MFSQTFSLFWLIYKKKKKLRLSLIYSNPNLFKKLNRKRDKPCRFSVQQVLIPSCSSAAVLTSVLVLTLEGDSHKQTALACKATSAIKLHVY